MATRKIIVGRCLILILFYIVTTVRSESNVAVNKTTEQSSDQGNVKYAASHVVDDCLSTDLSNGCCTHTERGHTTAWWRVDLGELMTIIRIKIYYRDNFQHRLAGYQLYVSNTTNTPTDGDLCFEDTSSTKDAVQLVVTHQCPYVGRYVTVYNYRNNPKPYSWYSDWAILELCEVQVFGCQAGRYGDGNCKNLCPVDCYGGNCNSNTGACFYCFAGKFGIYCNSDCPANCKDSLCTKDAGTCLDCVPQTYGVQCEYACSTNCLNSLCEKVNGYCYECIPGKYGNTCDQNCPANCKNMLCEKSTGNCIDCVPQQYGTRCEQDCSTKCQDRLCEKVNGNCYKCVTGKNGDACDKDYPRNCNETLYCVPQKYGINCDLNCSTNCLNIQCEKDNGECYDCLPQKYGNRCEQNCPTSCLDSLCEKDSGNCYECVAGKYGINCDQNCAGKCKDTCERDTGICRGCIAGWYDVTCLLTCPVTCKDFLCHQQTGHCLDCYPGKYGVVCGADCPDTCTDNICNKDNGHCLSTGLTTVESYLIAVLAVVCGLFLAALGAIAVLVFFLRKRQNRKNTSDKYTEQSVPDTGYTSISRRQEDTSQVYEMVVT